MKEIKKIKASRLCIVLLLLAMLIVPSCKPKATHLTQNLENSGVPVQSSTRADEVPTQAAGQGIAPTQSSTLVVEPTATPTELLTTQGTAGTLPSDQTPTSPLVVLTPTATKKSATVQPTASTLAPTQTRTSTPTRTATLTPTPTLQTGWEGEWIIYIQQANGTYTSGTMILALNGTEVIASANLDAIEYNFEGVNYAEGKQITGPWQTDSSSGYFWWMLVSDAQFGGSLDLQYGICGARAGAEKPDPCFIVPPS